MPGRRSNRQKRLVGDGDNERVVTANADGQVPDLWKPDYDEVKTLARLIVEDPVYLHNLRIRMIAGTVPPAVENMLWERAFGKVKDEVEVRKIESIRIVHEYLEDSRESQMAALRALPGEIVEAKLLGEHTKQPTDRGREGDGDGRAPEVVTPSGQGDEVADPVSGSGGVSQKREDDGSDLEAD